MNPIIKECLDKANDIRKIYEELYKKEIAKDWYPFQPYCLNCGKVSTTKVYDWDGEKVSFICNIEGLVWTKGCGFKGKISPFSDKNGIAGKLPWKIEWPAKWKALGITVEGAGKDHMSRGGSHDLASLVCERIIKYPVPYALPYEFFLIGGKKMSSSKGRGSSAAEMLEILPPELLRYLMVKTRINQQINFDPEGETIPKLFDEYQKAADAYFNKGDGDLSRIFEMSQVDIVKKPPMVSFNQLVQWVQSPNMQTQIEKEKALEWIPYVKIWIERFALQENKFSFTDQLSEKAKNLSSDQKKYLKKIISEIDKKWKPEELQQKLYEWSKQMNVPSGKAFAAIYLSLFDKTYGPKAAWIILSNIEFVKNRFLEASN
jgi:lysyl-tRNA synthetase class 1